MVFSVEKCLCEETNLWVLKEVLESKQGWISIALRYADDSKARVVTWENQKPTKVEIVEVRETDSYISSLTYEDKVSDHFSNV